MIKKVDKVKSVNELMALEGEITEAKFEILKRQIKKITKEEEDSITWYIFESRKIFRKETFGIEKGEPQDLIF
ncbi:CRISPR-associated endonuclease Cas2 [Petrotoga sp. 9PWA.NaAc.5.4]|uniref:CRISPR-associated endonuclease Cas2 n=1 Tax=Petrotoga sp. 9PWA.NaAc.5.4 TaxID=1434328 RepID=UPI001E364C7E|nr:CRISPR-associated endonuclease Cas2 [Petrotoga sp. 9PWA.NaAc.5.4]